MWLLATAAGAAPEVCNGLDDDGDGAVDEAPYAVVADADQDGHGVVVGLSAECAPALPVDDCDDGDGDLHPGTDDPCDGVDQDCDGAIDDASCPCEVVADGGVWQLCDALRGSSAPTPTTPTPTATRCSTARSSRSAPTRWTPTATATGGPTAPSRATTSTVTA